MRWWVAVAWIEELIKEGKKTVDEVEVFFVQGTSVSADLRNRKISLATTAYDCGLGIRTIHEGRIGSSSTNNPDQWRECLAAAIASAEADITHVNMSEEFSGQSAIDLKFMIAVRDTTHLESVLKHLRRLPSVSQANRVVSSKSASH